MALTGRVYEPRSARQHSTPAFLRPLQTPRAGTVSMIWTTALAHHGAASKASSVVGEHSVIPTIVNESHPSFSLSGPGGRPPSGLVLFFEVRLF